MTCAIAAISPMKVFPEEVGAITNKLLLSFFFPLSLEGRGQGEGEILSLRGAQRRGNPVIMGDILLLYSRIYHGEK